MSISQNFPDEGPSLNLNFASSRILDPRITFTRTSTGTYTDKNGLVTIASANTPRFDHSYNGSNVQSLGLLIEESRTNLTTYSEQFDNAAWSKTNAGITTNTSATTAPDGNTTADKLVENSASGNKEISQGSITFTSGTSLTFSCFVKAGERTLFRFAATTERFASSTNAYFNLTSGTVTSTTGGVTSASIIPYPNGWYRCIATMLPTSSGSGSVFITLVQSDTTTNYTGDGTSGIYIWGAQLEAGAFPTSYIPTVASTVTRSADSASMTGTNFTSWYNSSEGTIVAQGKRVINVTDYSRIVSFNDNSSLNILSIYTQVNSYNGYKVINGSENFFSGPTIVNSPTNQSKVALSHNTTNATIVTNGVFSGETNISGTSLVTRMTIGVEWYLVGYYNGTISQLSYYPRRLTNTQLQNLTK